MRKMFFGAALLCGYSLCAVTVGPDWCVVYPDNQKMVVNRALKVAAEEVRDDINEAVGLQLKAVPASKAKPPAIYIGAEFAAKAGFDLSGLKWYDNIVAEKDGSIYLYGNDRPGRDASKFGWNVGWFRCVLPSVKAATRFLETYAGVRFLMPGEMGKEVSKRKELSLPDGSMEVERPTQIYGNGVCPDGNGMIYRIANGVWGMGSFHTYGGHTWPSACPAGKYAKTHPEYFGVWRGKRLCNDVGLLCISNPEVEELVVAELNRQFDLGADVCQLAQNDGSYQCECDKCKVLYGVGDDWGEKIWIFHRKIAERMLKERPGKIVHILSYGATANPPKTFKVFPDNVMIEQCKISETFFRRWEGYTVPHGFTVYTYLSGSYLKTGFVPRRSFAYLATVVKRFRDRGVRGIYRCGACGGSGDLYGTEGPGYYLFNRLLLDGTQNVNALLADYCSAAFGPAAAQMRKFYDIQDARLRLYDCIYAPPFDANAAAGLDGYLSAYPKSALDLHQYLFSPDTSKQMEECLSRAERMDGLTAKHKKRLELVRLEFDYAKMMGEIATLYSAYKLRPSKEFIEPLMEVLEKRNDYLDRLFDKRKTPRRLEGWPELSPFGGYNTTRARMNVNGAMSAVIGAPLTWPSNMAKGVLPGAKTKNASAMRVDMPPTFSEFTIDSGWNRLNGISMESVPVQTRFKAMYDDRCLYVLVEGDLADGVELAKFAHDGPVWNDDAIDMLVAPGTTRDVYYHFLWGEDPVSRYDNVTGLITDPLDPMYGKADTTWNGKGWKVESMRGGGKWRTIASFPYSDFGIASPKPGDSWFINVGRIAKTGAERKSEILLLWSPNVESRSMVAPNAMGKLMFK